MDIEKQHFHFFNDIKIILEFYYDVKSLHDAYTWGLQSIEAVPLYTIIRVLNTTIIFHRQKNIDMNEIFTNEYVDLMIRIMQKYYTSTSSVINKPNVLAISNQIMLSQQHPKPLQLKTIKVPMKYKIDIQNSNFVYSVLSAFKKAHF